jgi:hypothetical protein
VPSQFSLFTKPNRRCRQRRLNVSTNVVVESISIRGNLRCLADVADVLGAPRRDDTQPFLTPDMDLVLDSDLGIEETSANVGIRL